MEQDERGGTLKISGRLSRRDVSGGLTRREREIALLVAEDLKNYSIARRLSLSPATVATYIQRIQSRLGLDSRQEIKVWVQAHRNTGHRDILPECPPADGAEPFPSMESPVVRAGAFGAVPVRPQFATYPQNLPKFGAPLPYVLLHDCVKD
jgi:DNA-binding CsgD family transcriptional regulator